MRNASPSRICPIGAGRHLVGPMGMFSDRWQVHDQTLRIGRRHRSSLETWLAGHSER
jgi:hypothetical protein